LLRAAGLKNGTVARQLGVTGATVSRYRSGDRTPNADVLAIMVALAHGSADEVLGLVPSSLSHARQLSTLSPKLLQDVTELADHVAEIAAQYGWHRPRKK
jgi:predicted transcriptional regulator